MLAVCVSGLEYERIKNLFGWLGFGSEVFFYINKCTLLKFIDLKAVKSLLFMVYKYILIKLIRVLKSSALALVLY